jgi:hypothetical protein
LVTKDTIKKVAKRTQSKTFHQRYYIAEASDVTFDQYGGTKTIEKLIADIVRIPVDIVPDGTTKMPRCTSLLFTPVEWEVLYGSLMDMAMVSDVFLAHTPDHHNQHALRRCEIYCQEGHCV